MLVGARQKVIELRKTHPEFTLFDIAGIINVSKQRVSQILKSENLPRHSTKYKSKYNVCKMCGRATINKFCSSECKDNGSNIFIACDFCKTSQKVSNKKHAYQMKFQKHFYCSNQCRYLGGQIFSCLRKKRL